jgi:hypothetical protein
VLTVEGNTLKVASAYSGQVSNYVATNPDMNLGGGEEPEAPAGWDGAKVYSVSGDISWQDMLDYSMGVDAYLTLSMDVDLDGNAKVGYASFEAGAPGKKVISQCVPYEFDANTLTLKGMNVGTMNMTAIEMDIPFVTEDKTSMTLEAYTFPGGYIIAPDLNVCAVMIQASADITLNGNN